jgi:hypothetical protein
MFRMTRGPAKLAAALLLLALLLAGAFLLIQARTVRRSGGEADTGPATVRHAELKEPALARGERNQREGSAKGGSHRPGARTLIPRFVVAGAAAAPDAAARFVPAKLHPGSGAMADKRTNPGPGAAELKAQIMKRLDQAREAAERCMERWAVVDPSLEKGVMLAFSLDADGLQEVWIEDRADIPSGPLQCLSEGVYQMDWSGLTQEPLKVSDKIRYEAVRDAGAR